VRVGGVDKSRGGKFHPKVGILREKELKIKD
jgi:hypothetical protein